MSVSVRLGVASDFAAVVELYNALNSRSTAIPGDVLVVADNEGRIIGVVRLAIEHGHCILRGMRVRPEFQRTGIGTRMLRRFLEPLGGRECFAIPYSHLLGFYGQIGFHEVPEGQAPPHLVERAASYRVLGNKVTIIRRPPQP